MTEIAECIDEGPINGMEKFLLPHKTEFAHWLHKGDSHLIRTQIIYTKRKKSYVFCPVHNEYIDVSAPTVSSKEMIRRNQNEKTRTKTIRMRTL